MLVERLGELRQNAINLVGTYAQRIREDTSFMLSYLPKTSGEQLRLYFGRGSIIGGLSVAAMGMATGSLEIGLAGAAVNSLGILHLRWLRGQVQTR